VILLNLVRYPIAWPDYQRYRDRTGVFASSMTYVAPVLFGVSIGGHTEQTWGHIVTSSYFPTQGVSPSLGRFFATEEEQPGKPPAVVVSYRFWRDHLGSESSIHDRPGKHAPPKPLISAPPPQNSLAGDPVLLWDRRFRPSAG
jgi:hypothetical protein